MLKIFKHLNKKEKAIVLLLGMYLVLSIAVSVIVITNCTVDFTQIVVLFAITFCVVIVALLVDFFRLYQKNGY